MSSPKKESPICRYMFSSQTEGKHVRCDELLPSCSASAAAPTTAVVGKHSTSAAVLLSAWTGSLERRPGIS